MNQFLLKVSYTDGKIKTIPSVVCPIEGLDGISFKVILFSC